MPLSPSPLMPSRPWMVLRFTTRLGTRIRSFIVVSKSCPPDMGRADSLSSSAETSASSFTASSTLLGVDHSKAFMRVSRFRSQAHENFVRGDRQLPYPDSAGVEYRVGDGSRGWNRRWLAHADHL